jgi:hypothetical protein
MKEKERVLGIPQTAAGDGPYAPFGLVRSYRIYFSRYGKGVAYEHIVPAGAAYVSAEKDH